MNSPRMRISRRLYCRLKNGLFAQQAWRYFERNLNSSTGLVNSVDGFASVTLWDQSAAIAALVSAYELKLIPASDF